MITTEDLEKFETTDFYAEKSIQIPTSEGYWNIVFRKGKLMLYADGGSYESGETDISKTVLTIPDLKQLYYYLSGEILKEK